MKSEVRQRKLIPFLEDWRRNDAKMEFEECDTKCLGQIQLREKVNSHKKFEGKLKRFKN